MSLATTWDSDILCILVLVNVHTCTCISTASQVKITLMKSNKAPAKSKYIEPHSPLPSIYMVIILHAVVKSCFSYQTDRNNYSVCMHKG